MLICPEKYSKIRFFYFEGKKATGVSFYQKEKIITVKANREVILSAGSIG